MKPCISWGALKAGEVSHADCEVINFECAPPKVCPCECLICKQAWFKKGRPRVNAQGKIERNYDL